MDRKIVTGCDIDDVVVPLLSTVLELYNDKYNDNLHVEQITDYNIKLFIKPECKNIFQEFCTDDLILNMVISDENREWLTRMHEDTILYFCSARHPYIIGATDKMLERNLSWYRSKQLIRCIDKHLLKFDYLTDDYIGNLIGGDYKKNIMTQPWNASFGRIDGINRVYSLKEAYEVIRNEVEI